MYEKIFLKSWFFTEFFKTNYRCKLQYAYTFAFTLNESASEISILYGFKFY